MVNNSNSILKIVSDFKANKWSTSKIEIDLEISNGLLGKAAKGKTKLSDEKFNKLEAYHIKHFLTAINPLKEVQETLGDLSDKVTTADKIHVPETNAFDVDALNKRIKELEWVAEIEKYCDLSGCIPQDLIDAHKNQNKPYKKLKQGKEVDNSWMDDASKNYVSNAEKLGLGNTSSYNPMNNPLFKSKMGIK